MIIAHDRLGVRREPGDRGIARDQQEKAISERPNVTLCRISHLRQDIDRGLDAVGAEEHPCNDDGDERQNDAGGFRRRSGGHAGPNLLQA